MAESRKVLAAIEAGMVRIADMPRILGVTKQRCHQLAARADFPRPLQTVPGRRLWRRSDVERGERNCGCGRGRRVGIPTRFRRTVGKPSGRQASAEYPHPNLPARIRRRRTLPDDWPTLRA